MSCFVCGSKFGFMRKEHGCKNCGFSFCNKCLTKQAVVPKKNNEVHHVCDKCYDILTGKVKNENRGRFSPPDAFKRRMAALDSKSSPDHGRSHGGIKQGPRSPGLNQQKYRGMSKADIEIAQRLERLMQDRKTDAPPVPTTSEMEQRLAALKGQQPTSGTTQPPRGQTRQQHNFYVPPDSRTAQDQTNDLLDEAHGEVAIESRHVTPQQDVENRLAHLRGNQPSPTSQPAMGPGDINRAKMAPSSVDVDLSGRGGDQTEIPLEDLNALIRASARELEMDAERAVRDLQRDTELRERLERLKADRLTDKKTDAIRTSSSGSPFAEQDDDDKDDDVATKTIIKQMLEEIKMDESLEASGIEPTSSTPSIGGCYAAMDEPIDPDELPWCCICNANATIRCTGCDDDLYCKRCFREGHKNTEYVDHEYREYRPRPKIK